MNLIVDSSKGVIINSFDDEDHLSSSSIRYSYFPDFYNPLNINFTNNASFFNPVSFVLYTKNKQFTEIVEQGTDELRHRIKTEYDKLLPTEKEKYALDNSSFVHEMRHFHDQIGTTAGLHKINIIIQDLMGFVIAYLQLKNKNIRKLPMKWCKDENIQDKYPFIKEYILDHRRFVEQISIFDASTFIPFEILKKEVRNRSLIGFIFPEYGFANIASEWKEYSKRLKHEGVQEKILNLVTPGQLIVIPGVPLNVIGEKIENISIGNRVLTEGTAFLIQRKLIGFIFGDECAQVVKNHFQRSFPLFEHPYMVSDLFITKYVGSFYESLITILSDHAMNSDHPDSFIRFHPGWRFMSALQTKAWNAESVEDYGKLLINKNRSSLDIQIKELYKKSEFWQMLHEKSGWKFGSSIARVIRDIASRASNIADLRKGGSKIFALPDVYLEKSPTDLPLPPILAIPEGGVMQPLMVLNKEAGHVDWSNWLFFTNFVANVLFKNELECPVKRLGLFCANTHEVCDKLTVSKSQELKLNCTFYRFLTDFGVDRKID